MRRFVVWFLIIVVILGVAADFFGRAYAQDKVATEIASAGKLSQKPEVKIGGFSFLAQVIRGQYDAITINAGRTTAAQTVTVTNLAATVQGLRVPASALASGRVPASLPTDTIAVEATAGYDEIAAQIAAQQPHLRNLQVRQAADNRVLATGTLNTPVGTIPVNVPIEFSVTGATIRVRAGTETLTNLAPATRGVVGEALGVELRMPKLPYNLTINQVSAAATGLQVKASGTNLDLRDWAA